MLGPFVPQSNNHFDLNINHLSLPCCGGCETPIINLKASPPEILCVLRETPTQCSYLHLIMSSSSLYVLPFTEKQFLFPHLFQYRAAIIYYYSLPLPLLFSTPPFLSTPSSLMAHPWMVFSLMNILQH